MKYQFEILKQTRANTLNAIENLSIEELNKTPAGFNNNIAWNFNHNIVVMQLLCYKISDLPMSVSTEMVAKYSKGSKPESFISEEEMNFFKELAISSIAKLENDLAKGIFKEYTPYSTSYNVKLNSINEAITFNNVHEGLHYGYILALKRAIFA